VVPGRSTMKGLVGLWRDAVPCCAVLFCKTSDGREHIDVGSASIFSGSIPQHVNIYVVICNWKQSKL